LYHNTKKKARRFCFRSAGCRGSSQIDLFQPSLRKLAGMDGDSSIDCGGRRQHRKLPPGMHHIRPIHPAKPRQMVQGFPNADDQKAQANKTEERLSVMVSWV